MYLIFLGDMCFFINDLIVMLLNYDGKIKNISSNENTILKTTIILSLPKHTRFNAHNIPFACGG